MSVYLMVAIGGALGALSRFTLGNWINQLIPSSAAGATVFPWATFSINLIGSVAIGLFFVLMAERLTSLEAYRPLVIVGFLGAFTTFSTFSLEMVSLVSQQAWLSAISYLSLSCTCCILGAALGIFIGRLL